MSEQKKTDPMTELKAKYGKVYAVRLTVKPDDYTEEDKAYAFRRPLAVEYDRYLKTAGTGMIKASRVFVLDCVVEEQRELLQADLEEYPAMALALADKLLTMLGLAQDVNLTRL